MAIVASTEPVTDSEGNSWQITGSVNTDTGAVTFVINGSEGQVVTEGTASQVTGLLLKLPPTPDNFVGDVINKINSMNVKLSRQATPPTEDTAARSVNSSSPGDALTPTEKNKLASTEPAPEAQAEPAVSSSEPVEIKTGKIEATPPTQILLDLPNVLHGYANWTYGLSLHALSAETYNKIAKNQEYVPDNVLISSAGRYDNTIGAKQFVRNAEFAEDFYFEDLNMTTLVGLNERSRNTNAIDIKFTLIEPYGVTLLDRLIDVGKALNGGNYLDMPYLLQIDFFGYNDDGTTVTPLPDITKRIPIKLLKMDIRVSVKGSEYNVQAIPFNHQAFTAYAAGTPFNLEVSASTIQGFFAAGSEDRLMDELDQENQRRADLKARNIADTSTARDKKYRVKSYATAVNTWQKFLVTKKRQTFEDEVYFKFDDSIGSKKLNIGTKLALQNHQYTDVTQTTAHRLGNAGGPITVKPNDYDTDQKVFSINAGTSVDKVIEFVIMSSDYELSQIWTQDDFKNQPDPKKAYQDKLKELENVPFKSYKVIPSIELKTYDAKNSRWAKKITYNIIPFEVRNTKIEGTPSATAIVPAKIYNYIYTGLNKDIIDLNLEFNTAYYTAITADPSKLNKISGSFDEERADNNVPSTYTQAPDIYNQVMPLVFRPQVADTQATATGVGNTTKEVIAADNHKSIYSGSKADMLVARVKIIGDPLFIKQDDLFYSPKFIESQKGTLNLGVGSDLTPNNSFRMDSKEIYVQLTVRTPTDIDESTGRYNLDTSKYRTALFSGMYKVLKVDTEFRAGQFTQTLEIIRLFRQKAFDYATVKEYLTTDEGRSDTPNDSQNQALNNIPQAPNFGASKTTADTDTSAPDPVAQPDNETNEQKDPDLDKLKQVADQGETIPMTSQSEPSTNTPAIPANTQQSVYDIKNDIDKITARSAAGVGSSRENLQDLTGALERLYVAENNRGNYDEAARVKAAIDSNKELLAEQEAALKAARRGV